MPSKTFWAGIIDGEIDVREVDSGWGGYAGKAGDGMVRVPMIFTSRANAREQYQKIAKVQIKIVK